MRRFGFQLLAWIGVLFLTPLRAQNIHIVSTQGDVAVTRGEGDHTVSRGVQSTLVTDDRIVTGEKSRADVQLDAANSVEVGASAEVRLGEVYPGRYQVILDKGAMTWRVEDATAAQMEVQTPSVSVRPHQPGVYTIGIHANGETEIVAKDGVLEIFAPTGSQWLTAGQRMLARGTPSNPEFQITGVSRWRRFLGALANLQIGAMASSFSSGDDRQRAEKPRTATNPIHSGSGRVSPPEANHPPATSSHQHAAAPQHSAAASAQHSAPAASAQHSAPASAPSAPASHGK